MEKILFIIIKKIFLTGNTVYYFYSLSFESDLVLFSVISTIKTYTENGTMERYPCNRKVFLVIKLP